MRDVLAQDEGGIEGGVDEGFHGRVEGQAFFEGGAGRVGNGGHGIRSCGWDEREGGEVSIRASFDSGFLPCHSFLAKRKAHREGGGTTNNTRENTRLPSFLFNGGEARRARSI